MRQWLHDLRSQPKRLAVFQGVVFGIWMFAFFTLRDVLSHHRFSVSTINLYLIVWSLGGTGYGWFMYKWQLERTQDNDR